MVALKHLDTKHRGSVSARSPVAWAVLLVVGLGWVERAAAQDVDVTDPEVLAAVSAAMSNPISSLIIFQSQFQLTQYKPPAGWTPPPGVIYPSEGEWGFQYQFIPTVPAPLGSKINLISRLGVPISGAPISSEKSEAPVPSVICSGRSRLVQSVINSSCFKSGENGASRPSTRAT